MFQGGIASNRSAQPCFEKLQRSTVPCSSLHVTARISVLVVPHAFVCEPLLFCFGRFGFAAPLCCRRWLDWENDCFPALLHSLVTHPSLHHKMP